MDTTTITTTDQAATADRIAALIAYREELIGWNTKLDMSNPANDPFTLLLVAEFRKVRMELERLDPVRFPPAPKARPAKARPGGARESQDPGYRAEMAAIGSLPY